MKYIVIIICLVLIALALLILFKFLRDSFKGKCCSNCTGCQYNDECQNKK